MSSVQTHFVLKHICGNGAPAPTAVETQKKVHAATGAAIRAKLDAKQTERMRQRGIGSKQYEEAHKT